MIFACGPATALPAPAPGLTPVALFTKSTPRGGISAGGAAADAIRRKGFSPTAAAWDLLSLALAAIAADHTALRRNSADGWTRQIELNVVVSDKAVWASLAPRIASTLAFLTTDIWRITFTDGAQHPPAPKQTRVSAAEASVLLSGGLDSLIGVTDLHQAGVPLLAVSHTVRGDRANQVLFASKAGVVDHLEVNHNVSTPWAQSETSQRARSLLFLAFAVLGATVTEEYAAGGTVPVYICENGFIAINPPLTAGRVGSLSTRTAHPHFLGELQEILTAVGLRVRLANPYAEMTKGEMLTKSADPDLLGTLASSSTSCGRYQRHKLQHCGRCVPCSVRRASFFSAGWADDTAYLYDDLSRYDGSELEDLRALRAACLQARSSGLDRWIGSALSSPHIDNRAALRSMLERGLAELEAHLDRYGVS
ncbi:Qat anti-phage system QueC-like protein QatC [Cellulosimicrobium funkei]|uniref:Qat anti-phage system QueC-like protein QatC n=1 Tax=Cellulosimicrobium funkei TaxID=264251 RepID=UPI0036B8C40E